MYFDVKKKSQISFKKHGSGEPQNKTKKKHKALGIFGRPVVLTQPFISWAYLGPYRAKTAPKADVNLKIYKKMCAPSKANLRPFRGCTQGWIS